MSNTTITKQNAELRDALLTAFPPEPIGPDAFVDPGGAWEQYDDAKGFVSNVVGRTWSTVDKTTIEAYPDAIGLVGLPAFVSLLPSYLLYLVEHEAFNDVPFHTAGVLTRERDKVGQQLFDQYIGALTDEQRGVVKMCVLALSRREPMKTIMKQALRSHWHGVAPITHPRKQKGP